MYGEGLGAIAVTGSLLFAAGTWVWRNLASRLVWREGSVVVRLRHTVRMSGFVAYRDESLDVQLDYEWSDSVYYVETPSIIYSTREPAHDLSDAEKALVLQRVDRAFEKLGLICSFGKLPGL